MKRLVHVADHVRSAPAKPIEWVNTHLELGHSVLDDWCIRRGQCELEDALNEELARDPAFAITAGLI